MDRSGGAGVKSGVVDPCKTRLSIKLKRPIAIANP
jgi:hypothetical protein